MLRTLLPVENELLRLALSTSRGESYVGPFQELMARWPRRLLWLLAAYKAAAYKAGKSADASLPRHCGMSCGWCKHTGFRRGVPFHGTAAGTNPRRASKKN